jgi:hypothetical protein
MHMYVCMYYMYLCMYVYVDVRVYAALSNEKRKPGRRFSLVRLPLAHRVNRSLSFVHLFDKKQTEVIHLQLD